MALSPIYFRELWNLRLEPWSSSQPPGCVSSCLLESTLMSKENSFPRPPTLWFTLLSNCFQCRLLFTSPCLRCFLRLQHPRLPQPLVITWPGSLCLSLSSQCRFGTHSSLASLLFTNLFSDSGLYVVQYFLHIGTLQALVTWLSKWILLNKLVFQGLNCCQLFVPLFFPGGCLLPLANAFNICWFCRIFSFAFPFRQSFIRILL